MTTLTAFYDLAVGPVSFDFVVFAVQAEIERRRIGARRLHFCIVPDPNGPGGFRDKSHFYDEHEARWRLNNIVLPATQLFGASYTFAADWLQAKRLASDKDWKQWPADWDRQTLKARHHLVGGVIRSSCAGTEVPTIHPSEHAGRKVREWFGILKRPVVTMTLRSTYMPQRNSQREGWLTAKCLIEARGYAVVLLEDTSVALRSGTGYGELNLDLRVACYENAALNLQSNNGSASLCWFGTKPYRMFDAGIPAEDWHGLFVMQGLPLGHDWAWAGAEQRLIYAPSTAPNIMEEFGAWESATK